MADGAKGTRTGSKTIVFSDVDGTLLNSEHRITPLTRRAIERVQEQGIPFVIVTARGITGTYPMLDQNDISCFVVTYSGGVILDRERRVIYHRGFSKADAQEIIGFLSFEGFDVAWNAYSFEDWVTPDRSDGRVRNEERIVMAEAREGTISSIERDEVQKLLLICDSVQTPQIEARLKARFPQHAIARSSDILIEVMPAGTSKANAVRTLCDLMGADLSSAIAFGDNYNDVPMLEAVGRGYLMGNAPAEIKERISLQTLDNDHDGIYEALVGEGLIDRAS